MNVRMAQIESIVKAYSCAVPPEGAIYVSTPVTNGPRIISALKNNPHIMGQRAEEVQRFKQKEVIAPNCKAAQAFANKLRQERGEVVIDPSCFFVEGWSQQDYLDLWEKVICEFASSVIFNVGWQYSNGCVYEFSVAVNKGLPTYVHDGSVVDVDCAVPMILNAATELEDVGVETSTLRRLANQLKSTKIAL